MRPRLEGVRVLVTRPRERAEELCFLLEDEGAEVVALPMLELGPPEDPRPLRAAAEQIHRFAWVAFASPTAVERLLEAVREAGTLERLRRLNVAVVGPRTAKAAADAGLDVQVEAPAATGGDLGKTLAARLEVGGEVLLPAAQEGLAELEEGLRAAGASVVRVAAYRAERAPLAEEALVALRAAPPNAALFASPRSLEVFLESTGEEGRAWLEQAKIVAIGPTTAAAIAQRRLTVAAVAVRPSAEGLVEATFQAVRG
jgi:uroporphyrinogen-III synthase